MRVHSAKIKGARLQKRVAEAFVASGVGLEKDDVRSASMGAPGEDILFSPTARKQYPFSVECKNVEKLSIWAAIDQARANCPEGSTPMVCFSRNHEKTFVTLEFDKFMEIYSAYLRFQESK